MTTTEPASTPALPSRYTELRRIARGGMGEVWHARDSRLDRDVAIKLVTTGDGLEDDATRRARFEREARVVARLSTHPNVVTIYDIGEAGDRPFLAMEWMSGGTLAERFLGTARLPIDELLDTLERVASALDAAHADGIVHRDVKPGNVMFDSSGTPRIGDFGIASYAADPSVTLTQVGAVVGTSGYIAPEQATGDGAVPASDQYALMVIAFEGLAGQRPFAREGVVAELAAHVSAPIPAATAHSAQLPPEVDDVFMRALDKHPDDRYPTCAAAVAALREALDHPAPTVAHPAVPITERLAAVRDRIPHPAPVRAPVPAPVTARIRRRVGIAASIVLVTMLAILVAGAFGDDDPPADPVDTTARTQPTETTTTTTETTPEAEPEPEPTPAADPEVPTAEQVRAAAIERHEQSFAALQDGRFQEAYDLGVSALGDLGGVSPWEAFANYNVGAALVGLGRCAEAMPYLDRSEVLQGQRDEIDAARDAANACLNAGAPGNGKDKGAKKDKGSKGD